MFMKVPDEDETGCHWHVIWLEDDPPDPEAVLADPEIQKLAQEAAASLD